MDKESIRSILANISMLANVVPLESEKIEAAIALLDLMVIEEKGLGYSIEERPIRYLNCRIIWRNLEQ